MSKRNFEFTYGVPVEVYDAMAWDQRYLCLICKRQAPLVLDHDHKTGKIRGLLCRTCNSGLGMFKDSPSILRSAIEYLSIPRPAAVTVKPQAFREKF